MSLPRAHPRQRCRGLIEAACPAQYGQVVAATLIRGNAAAASLKRVLMQRALECSAVAHPRQRCRGLIEANVHDKIGGARRQYSSAATLPRPH